MAHTNARSVKREIGSHRVIDLDLPWELILQIKEALGVDVVTQKHIQDMLIRVLRKKFRKF